MKAPITILLLLVAHVANAAPVTWNFDDGGNGHIYEVRVTASPITWENAKIAAEAAGGHLATITSAQENNLIKNLVAQVGSPAHIGGYQPDEAAEPAEGWSWVTGEPFSYTNWYPNVEPNNAGPWGNEDRLQMYVEGFWNDIYVGNPYYYAYVIEIPLASAVARPLASYSHNLLDGLQALKNFRLNKHSQCLFTFSTAITGRTCIVSWSEDFSRWNPLLHFEATTEGTEVVDIAREPSQFYRAAFLPAGVSAAESFDYPVGTGTVTEQIDTQPNNLYLSTSESNVERPTSSQSIDPTKWRNAQDVGSYLLTTRGPGYHAGEDWNLGGGSDDIGEQVLSVANGIVVDISPLNNNSNGGWAMVIRHYLLNGEVMDSVYLHIAPPTLSDRSSPNLSGVVGVESWFPFQEGMAVSKGAVVAVVADVDAAIYHDHLHFEMRNKIIPNLPLANGVAAVSAYWPRSMGNAYYATFSAMQQEGIIDPSDFIDQN